MSKKQRKHARAPSAAVCAVMEDRGYTAVREMVKQSEYICASCSRIARQMEHLCEPERLDRES